jgi:polyisoprenoid-binding protein YceI
VARYDAETAECLVFTHKEGVLSALAHDLILKVTSFLLDIDEDRIEASFDAASLRVVSAARQGVPADGVLSDKNKREIESNIRKDVLHSGRHPTIRFAGRLHPVDNDHARIEGRLELHGKTKELSFMARREGKRHVAELTLHQPDFDVVPYRALMGTLRVQAQVTVRVRLQLREPAQ